MRHQARPRRWGASCCSTGLLLCWLLSLLSLLLLLCRLLLLLLLCLLLLLLAAFRRVTGRSALGCSGAGCCRLLVWRRRGTPRHSPGGRQGEGCAATARRHGQRQRQWQAAGRVGPRRHRQRRRVAAMELRAVVRRRRMRVGVVPRHRQRRQRQ